MANYDTTADPIEAYYDPRQSIRNPDYQPFGGGGDAFSDYKGVKLLKSGWMPDKKHSFMENLGRVASLGIYNPDDRAASAINKKVLTEHGLNVEDRGNTKQKHLEEIDQIAADYKKVHPEVTDEAAQMEAANIFVARLLAEQADLDAATAEAGLRTTKARAEIPKAGDVVRGSQAATMSADEANKGRNEDLSQYYRGLKSVNFGSQRAGNASTAEDFRNEQNLLGLEQARENRGMVQPRADLERRQIEGANTVLNDQGLQQALTAADRLEAAKSGAQSTAAQAGAAARALSNPSTADAIYGAGVNRQFGLPVPSDSSVYVPMPVVGSMLQGPPHSGRMDDYTTTTEVVEGPNGEPMTIRRRTAGRAGAPAPTTAERPAGTVTPGAPIQGGIVPLDEMKRFQLKSK